MKKKLFILIPIIIILAVGGFFGVEAIIMSNAPDAAESAETMLTAIISSPLPKEAESDEAKAIEAAVFESRSFTLGETEISRRDAVVEAVITQLDPDSIGVDIVENCQRNLERMVEEAKYSSDIYDAEKNYKPEVLSAAASEALNTGIEAAKTKEIAVNLRLRYEDRAWQLKNADEINDALNRDFFDVNALSSEICEEAKSGAEYVRKIYTIEENAKKGPVPAAENFGSTTDPAVIEELLKTPEAQALINGQKLAWNKDIQLIRGTEIHYYLDETILCIVWQEEEALAVGTFSEIFIADASQLRRKIAGDTYGSSEHRWASTLSKEVNAVLGVGGDLYHHDRNCGIMVYERDVYRYDMRTCDVCYIDTKGDMLFSYQNQFSSKEEVDAFVEENDILFSLSFGPVLIDNGEDKTPAFYNYGEINDTYARSSLGILGDKHYLTMNINCMFPDNYYLATLRQAADAMIEKGCIKAYALDGGQTATTVFNGKLINPVQFGVEREISDIIYFASAVPN